MAVWLKAINEKIINPNTEWKPNAFIGVNLNKIKKTNIIRSSLVN